MPTSPKPAPKNADSKKPAKTATTKATPHNGDKTGCVRSAAHYPRSPRRAWLQEAVRGDVSRAARHCSHASYDVIHDPLLYGPRTAGPFSQRET